MEGMLVVLGWGVVWLEWSMEVVVVVCGVVGIVFGI